MEKHKYLISLDGDRPSIGREEIEALSDAENLRIRKKEEGNLEMWVESNDEDMWVLNKRSAYIKKIYKVLGPRKELTPECLQKVFRNRFLSYHGIPGTFRIDTDLLSAGGKKSEVIDKVADLISKKTWAEVSLSRPDKIFAPCIKDSKHYLFVKLPPLRKGFRDREPKYRPYSPSITMGAKLSRGLVNLSRASPDMVFLDPFCGSGSLLLEAASLGCDTKGCDLSKTFLKGARWNAEFYQLSSRIKIFKADGTDLPLSDNSIWSIASDPPYGKAASLFGKDIEQLYQDFLEEAKRVLVPQRFLAFCSPSPVEGVMRDLSGWRKLFHTKRKVHGSLTRHIFVFQNKRE